MTDRERQDETGMAKLRTAIFDEITGTMEAFPSLRPVLQRVQPGAIATMVDCIVDAACEYADALEAERDLLAAKITAVEALVGRFEAAGISCHALGHYEREADY